MQLTATDEYAQFDMYLMMDAMFGYKIIILATFLMGKLRVYTNSLK